MLGVFPFTRIAEISILIPTLLDVFSLSFEANTFFWSWHHLLELYKPTSK